MDKRSKIYDFLVTAALLLLTIFSMHSGESVIRLNDDVATYLGLSDSILESSSYTFNFKAHTKFAFGFPVLIASAKYFGITETASLHGLLAIFGSLSLLASYLFMKRIISPAAAAIAVIVIATSPFYFETATRWLLAELPYLFFSMCTLLFWFNCFDNASQVRGKLFCIGTSVALLLALTTHSIGFLLVFSILALAVIALLRGRIKRCVTMILIAVPSILFAVFWHSYTVANEVLEWPDQYMHSYSKQILMADPHQPELGLATTTIMIERVARNLILQAAHFAEVVFHIPWLDPLWFSPLIVLSLSLIVTGIIVRVRQQSNIGLSEAYLVLYVIVLLFWPFDEHARLILPVCPLLLLYFYLGACAVFRLWQKEPTNISSYFSAAAIAIGVLASLSALVGGFALGLQAKIAVASWFILALLIRNFGSGSRTSLLKFGTFAGIIVLMVAGVYQQNKLRAENLAADGSSFEHYELSRSSKWLSEQTSSNETIMATQAGIVHYLTGRRVAEFPTTTDANLLMETIDAHGVKLLLASRPKRFEYFSPTDDERLKALLKAYPKRFDRELLSGRYQFVRILPPQIEN